MSDERYPAHLYLTDEQYLKILYKIKEVVSTPGFKIAFKDSTAVGDKYTTSNCGLCNEAFTEKETCLFPDHFERNRSMKHLRSSHKCPFDKRNFGEADLSFSCFFTCRISTRFGRLKTRDKAIKLVDKTIDEWNKLTKENVE